MLFHHPIILNEISGESEESCTRRDELDREIKTLRSGMDICKQYVGFHITDSRDES